MKYLFISIICGMLWSCSNEDSAPVADTNSDSLNHVASNDSTSVTTIQWVDSTTQDLGKLNEGQIADISWRFRNAGTKPLVIANVTAGCGCTVAEKPQAPLAPGEEGVIRAKFDSKNQSGQQNKNVTVHANTPEAMHILTFRAEVSKK